MAGNEELSLAESIDLAEANHRIRRQDEEILLLKGQLAEARTHIQVLTGELRDARRLECERFMQALRLTLEGFYRDVSR